MNEGMRPHSERDSAGIVRGTFARIPNASIIPRATRDPRKFRPASIMCVFPSLEKVRQKKKREDEERNEKENRAA